MGVLRRVLLGCLVLASAEVGLGTFALGDSGPFSDCGLVNWHDGKPLNPAERETICAYFRSVHQENFQKAYGLFSRSLQKKLPYPAFLAAINVSSVTSASGVSTADGGPRPQASGREYLGMARRPGMGHVYTFAEDFPNFTDSTTLAFDDGGDGKVINGFETTRNW